MKPPIHQNITIDIWFWWFLSMRDMVLQYGMDFIGQHGRGWGSFFLTRTRKVLRLKRTCCRQQPRRPCWYKYAHTSYQGRMYQWFHSCELSPSVSVITGFSGTMYTILSWWTGTQKIRYSLAKPTTNKTPTYSAVNMYVYFLRRVLYVYGFKRP